MARNISILILSVIILATGVIAFRKLDYLDKSVRIFTFGSSAPFEGRMGRGEDRPDGRDGSDDRRGFREHEVSGDRTARSEMHQFPDKTRGISGSGEEGPEMIVRNIPDSLKQQYNRADLDRMVQPSFEGRIRNGEGRGRGEFHDGRKINLRSVFWFLAVFASFTVVIIYIDKTLCLVRKR